MQQLLVSKENVLPEEQEDNMNSDQNHSQPPNIKEEQEELWVSKEGKQLHGLGEAEIPKFSFTVVSVKSEDEVKPQSSQLHQSQRDESTEVELLSSNSTEPRTLKTEADGEDCGGSQPARDPGPCSHFQPDTDDMQQLLLIKEEIFPEQQQWNLSVDQEDMKEEQDKLWISQQGQQLHRREEADITKFTFTAVPMKSENGDEKPQSSQIHQSQSDESTEAEPVASSSTVHRTLTAQADGEDDGGPQPPSNSGPNSHLQPDTSGRSSDISETDSYKRKQIKKRSSGSNYLKNSSVSVSHSRCNMTQKHFNCSEYEYVCGHMNYSKRQKRRQGREKPFSCSECGTRFGEKSKLNQHMRIHTGEKPFGCSECSKRFGHKSNLIRHTRIHTGAKPFSCSECGSRFGQKSTLNKHMRIHTGEKPVSCSECGKRLGHKSYLNIHMRIHTGQNPFSCSDCGKRFGQKGHLFAHMRIHTGQKPFGCSECDKRFGEKSKLNQHTRIHTGEKPFGCSECDKRFGQKGDLNKHMRIHTGQKPFGCSECDKRFGQKVNLNTHMRIHTGQKPFGCSECEKRFGQKGDLNTHMRIHTGEKPFGCLECGKRFGEKSSLNKHMRIHTGQKPFGCSECDKRFGQKGNLNKHMRIHTGQKLFSS